MAQIQIKIEPEEEDDSMDVEVSLKMENGDESQSAVSITSQHLLEENVVVIKEELRDNIDVKIEPLDIKDTNEEDGALDEKQGIYYESEPEDLSVRKPTGYSSGDEDKSQGSDLDYLLPLAEDKTKEPNVKPTFNGKIRKDKEQKYSDEITKHIEIVTIDEPARQLEHRELLAGRLHMNYTCEPCALGFVVEEAYVMHMKIHSPENGPHECSICKSRVKSLDVLYRHRLRHYRRYRCAICRLQLRDKDTVAAHVMREHLGSAFLCTHCGRGFKRPQYLKRHVEQMHTRPLHLECPVCHRVFYERGWYRCHVRTHNEQVKQRADRKAVCSHCGREFRNKSYLIRHLQTHEDRRQVRCPQCARSFKNNEVLRVHRRQHHTENPSRYSLDSDGFKIYPSTLSGPASTTCEQCGRVLTTRAMLTRHVNRMHTDRTKKFQCDYCKRHYFSKAEVRSHIEWTHLQQRRHACTCGRVFRTPARLRAHACAVHLRIQQPRDKTCPVCGKMFANQQVLTRHIRGHSGETYPCTECGQSFKTQSYVKIHYKIKHLNMTRAEIKAQSKRKLIMLENVDESMSAKIKKKKSLKKDPLNIEGAVRIKKEITELTVPLFETFVDIQREY
ncbi:zinc finger protein 850 [Danaus plexippus plexippus]|uniref:Zinc finger protein 850 n=1 Tax=Danaus plexippus plexippus TaxID=278856 RepID=A0A212FBW1_DANPL|nr:zinc finger protein 850 [Danaus plexippus plexippus]